MKTVVQAIRLLIYNTIITTYNKILFVNQNFIQGLHTVRYEYS